MVFIQVLFIVAALTPYTWNAVKLSNCDFESDFKCEIIHGIGAVIPPSSLITVWFSDDSGKEEVK